MNARSFLVQVETKRSPWFCSTYVVEMFSLPRHRRVWKALENGDVLILALVSMVFMLGS